MNQQTQLSETQKSVSANAAQLQFLTFTVGREEYGVDIMKVREIKAWSDVTRLPNAPEYMRGVMNLRGLIIPIFDLRSRFGMGKTDAHEKNVVIILAVGSRTIGILVDTVSDILSTHASEIKPAPKMETVDDEFLNGLISINERMVALLDVDYLFDKDVIESANKIAATNV
jgi:purine-binding chemotaxis protein CheW